MMEESGLTLQNICSAFWVMIRHISDCNMNKFKLVWLEFTYYLRSFLQERLWQESQNWNAFQSHGKWCNAAVGGRGRDGTLLLGNTCSIVADSPCQFKQTTELEWNVMWPPSWASSSVFMLPFAQMFIEESPCVELLSLRQVNLG